MMTTQDANCKFGEYTGNVSPPCPQILWVDVDASAYESGWDADFHKQPTSLRQDVHMFV